MKPCSRKPAAAYSLVELMAAIVILGIILLVTVPRVFSHDEASRSAACQVNRRDIEIQAELWINNTGSYPLANLNDVGGDLAYFPEGLPTCPVDGTAYTIDTSTGRVVGHIH
jgi:prepilin-type N-terminal cleavage/methylation domain-containing protein